MTGFIKYTGILMMIALFTIAIFTFSINFAIDNNANISLVDEGFSSDDLEDNVETFYTNVNTSSDQYMRSTISSQTEASEGGTQFKVTPATSSAMAKNSLEKVWEKLFGKDSEFGLFLTALISIITFTLFMLGWKAWVGRNPE